MAPISGLARVLFSFLFTILVFVGVVGNSVVITAIAFDHNMRRSAMNLLLLNLAVADLLNLCLSTADWLPQVVLPTSASWPWWSWMCPLARYLQCVFLFTSISTQLIVSIERYVAIVHPMRARVLCRRRNAVISIAVAWLFCAAFASPYAAFHRVVGKPSQEYCHNSVASALAWSRYKWAEMLVFYLIPCTCILAIYSRIAHTLWWTSQRLTDGQNNRTRASQSSSSSPKAGGNAASNEPRSKWWLLCWSFNCDRRTRHGGKQPLMNGHTEGRDGCPPSSSSVGLLKQSITAVASAASTGTTTTAEPPHRRAEALQTRRNVVKMLIACVCVYLICYSPIQFLFLSKTLFDVRIHPPYFVVLLMNALAMTCSASNPLLYTLFSVRFRRKLGAVLCGHCAQPTRSTTTTQNHVTGTLFSARTQHSQARAVCTKNRSRGGLDRVASRSPQRETSHQRPNCLLSRSATSEDTVVGLQPPPPPPSLLHHPHDPEPSVSAPPPSPLSSPPHHPSVPTTPRVQ